MIYNTIYAITAYLSHFIQCKFSLQGQIHIASKETIQKARGIFKYMRPYRGMFIIGWIFLVLSASAGMIFPFLMGQLLGSGTSVTPSMADSIEAIDLNNVSTVVIALFILWKRF